MARGRALTTKTDVPALSAASVAGAISMFTANGPYVLLNMMTGATLMLLIFAYVARNARDGIESIAFAFVASFIALPIAGWAFERNPIAADDSSVSQLALLSVWLIMALAFLLADREWQIRRASRAS